MPRKPDKPSTYPPPIANSSCYVSAMTVHVFLDSSVLRSLNPNGVLGCLLHELCESDILRIHIPVVVEGEIVAGIQLESRKKKHIPREIMSALQWSAAGGAIGEEDIAHVRDVIEKGIANAGTGFSAWLDEVGAERHSITQSAAAATLDAYFAGRPPFKRPKSREDLPDGFIHAAIAEFARRIGAEAPTHVVVQDKALMAALEKETGVIVHQNWASLLRCDALPNCDDARFRALWRVQESAIRAKFIEAITSKVAGVEVSSCAFPSDNQDATITMVGEVTGLQVDLAESRTVGADTVEVPFSCEVEGCKGDLFIFKSEYFTSQDDRFMLIDGDWNSHYVFAQTDIDLAVEGSFLIGFKESVDPSKVKIESIEVIDADEPHVTSPKEDGY